VPSTENLPPETETGAVVSGATDTRYEGTELRTDHNYSVVEEPGNTQFILAPRSNQDLEVIVLHQGTVNPDQQQEQDNVENGGVGVDENEANVAASIATEGIIEAGAEFQYHDRSTPTSAAKTPPNTAAASEAEADEASGDFRDPRGHRFIACERKEEWLDALNDPNQGLASGVLQRLLDCPALSGLQDGTENGLNMDFVVRTWDRTGGGARDTRTGIGPLSSWNYAESLEPVQLIQSLRNATESFMCLDRMYCPFYDTLIFIFTNPMPDTLKSEATDQWRLQTMPGLQHFLGN
jgi:hypothetical protein